MKSHSPRNMVIFLCRRPNYPIQFHPSDQTSVVSLVRHWQRGPWTQPEPEPTAQATAQPTARIEMEPRRRQSWSGTPRDARTHGCDHWRSPMECETSDNVRIEDPLDPISATQGSKGITVIDMLYTFPHGKCKISSTPDTPQCFTNRHLHITMPKYTDTP